MLSSIHPLGERGRNSNYIVTVMAYVIGSMLGGMISGALFGGMGRMLTVVARPSAVQLAVAIAAIALLGVGMDLRLGGMGVPSYHRQVNEDWLNRYRGWVYGTGFGVQLGFGFATVVPSAAVYATFALAALSGSVQVGILVGLTFGLVRSLLILSMAGVDTPQALRSAHRRLAGMGRWAHRTVVGAQAAVGVVAIGVLLWQ